MIINKLVKQVLPFLLKHVWKAVMPEIKATNIKNNELEKRISEIEKAQHEIYKMLKKKKNISSEYNWGKD